MQPIITFLLSSVREFKQLLVTIISLVNMLKTHEIACMQMSKK